MTYSILSRNVDLYREYRKLRDAHSAAKRLSRNHPGESFVVRSPQGKRVSTVKHNLIRWDAN